MNISKLKYFNFPICFLKDIFNNKTKTFDNILCYSIYKYALYINNDIEEIDKINKSLKHFNITTKDERFFYNNSKKIYNSVEGNEALTGIELEKYWEFKTNEKTEFEIVTLLAFLGIKSIIGAKTDCKTNKELLFSRMSGNTKTTTSINDELRKHLTRYNFDKIITELKLNWNLKYYSYHTKGFYVSFELTLEQLMTKCEANRQSNKIKILKSNETEIRKKVIQKINDDLNF